MDRLTLIPLSFVCSLAFVWTSSASQIPIFNTGESTGGTALAVGQSDPNYSLISAPAGVALTTTTTSPFPTWIANTPTADWISPGNSGLTNWAAGNYDYQTSFSLAGVDPASAQLSGSWTSDNNACIFLNGVNTGDCIGFDGFGSLSAFSITSGFIAGTNTLDFIVANGTPSPTGILAEISGSASPVVSGVPEPSPIPNLIGLALFGIAALTYRAPSLRN
jgi:hypothetical protein